MSCPVLLASLTRGWGAGNVAVAAKEDDENDLRGSQAENCGDELGLVHGSALRLEALVPQNQKGSRSS